MNTPTEAHLDLALQISEAIARSGNVAAAQLIADSEARAIAKQVEALEIIVLRWDKVEKELVALRARAERAERELETEKNNRNHLIEKGAGLERELTAERARLDSGQIMLIVAGERVWHCGVDLRAAIDASIWRAEARSSIRHFLNTTQ